MPRRAASVTQADIARVLRAMKDAGLPVQRVVARADGVVIETGDPAAAQAPGIKKLVDQSRVVVL